MKKPGAGRLAPGSKLSGRDSSGVGGAARLFHRMLWWGVGLVGEHDVQLEDVVVPVLVDLVRHVAEIDVLVLGQHRQQLLLQLREVVGTAAGGGALARHDDGEPVLGDGGRPGALTEKVEECHGDSLLSQPKRRPKSPRFSSWMKRWARSSPRNR